MLWDLLSSPRECQEQEDGQLQSLETHRHLSNPLHLPNPGYEIHNHPAHYPQPPWGHEGRNVGEASTFYTDWALTQCILEEEEV